MDTHWYYTVGGTAQHGPITESELHERIRSGATAPTELAWSEGMAQWATIADIPVFQSATAHQPDATPRPTPARDAPSVQPFGFWLSVVGIFNILSGAILVFSCFGIPVGLIMILSGTAALGARTALESLSDIPAPLIPALAKLRTYFMLTGLLALLNLALFLFFLIAFGSLTPLLTRLVGDL